MAIKLEHLEKEMVYRYRYKDKTDLFKRAVEYQKMGYTS